MFVVVDVETTGLFPSRHHRVVEIAAIRMDQRGEIQEEFVSLVNPSRDIGPTSIHGLVSADIVDAPTFADLAGHLTEFFDGAFVYVGHNVRFDADFIASEFRRCGLEPPELPLACTMQLSGGGSLCSCCETHGIAPPLAAHSALDDARAAAMLFRRYISRQIRDVPVRWPILPRSSRTPVTRGQVRERPQSNPYLMRLAELSRDDSQSTEDADLLAYSALLERVLEDRRIDADEGNALIETASRWGLSLEKVESLHGEFVRRLSAAALVDGVLTESEQRDIRQVAALLGRSQKEVDDCLEQAIARIESAQHAMKAPPSADWTGQTVCFTGELSSTIGGELLTRADAQALATRAGLNVLGNVTKKLDILVVADPNTQSGKAKKARDYGTRIVAEPVFWKSIGVAVD